MCCLLLCNMADMEPLRKEFAFHTVEAIKHDHSVDFLIYEGIGYLEQFSKEVKLGINESLGPNYGNSLLCEGHIKWDGCSNWKFGEGYSLHFCSIDEAESFAKLMPDLYKWAAEIMTDTHNTILE
jgi:hypothetical protein